MPVSLSSRLRSLSSAKTNDKPQLPGEFPSVSDGKSSGSNVHIPVDQPVLSESPVPKEIGLAGEVKHTKSGRFFLIEKTLPLSQNIGLDRSYAPIEVNLSLVRGIGQVTRARLESEGYCTIDALSEHPRWCNHASEVLQAIKKRSVQDLLKAGATDAEVLAFFCEEDLAFLDIETTGLSSVLPLFLVGVLTIKGDTPVIRQYLARSFEEEISLLEGLADELAGSKCLVTFNGRSFDVPFINGRFAFHRINYRIRQPNIDLLMHARRLYRNKLPDCRLGTLESHLLGSTRVGDVPGHLIPELYHRFVKTQDGTLIESIIEHNSMDLVSMTRLINLVGESHRRPPQGNSAF